MRLGHLELARCSAPVLKEIARTFNVTAHIAVLDGDQALFLAKADGEIRPCCDIYSGRRTNLQCSAVGKILLAYMDTAKQAEYLSRHRVMRHTPRSIASAEQLTAMVDAVRHDGYALDDQEEELLVRCLAVPVFDQRNVFSCALGITGTPNEIRTGEFHRLINFLKRRSGQLKAVISQPSALSSSDS
jgi:IclR family pca regulon transcriptional regulator